MKKGFIILISGKGSALNLAKLIGVIEKLGGGIERFVANTTGDVIMHPHRHDEPCQCIEIYITTYSDVSIEKLMETLRDRLWPVARAQKIDSNAIQCGEFYVTTFTTPF